MNGLFSTKLMLAILIGLSVFSRNMPALAQDKNHYVRIVNLVIEPSQLEAFKVALKEDVETAIRTEPGVLTLHVVQVKDNPTHLTLFEIYANEAAHKAHQQTAHFLTYRKATEGMVKSVTRTEMIPVALEAKPRL